VLVENWVSWKESSKEKKRVFHWDSEWVILNIWSDEKKVGSLAERMDCPVVEHSVGLMGRNSENWKEFEWVENSVSLSVDYSVFLSVVPREGKKELRMVSQSEE
jgi:hypothetical protein